MPLLGVINMGTAAMREDQFVVKNVGPSAHKQLVMFGTLMSIRSEQVVINHGKRG